MSRKSLLLATLVLTSLSAGSALAQGHMGTPQEQKACAPDAKRFCRSQLGDDFGVQNCLTQNRAKLSKRCSAVFQSHGM